MTAIFSIKIKGMVAGAVFHLPYRRFNILVGGHDLHVIEQHVQRTATIFMGNKFKNLLYCLSQLSLQNAI